MYSDSLKASVIHNEEWGGNYYLPPPSNKLNPGNLVSLFVPCDCPNSTKYTSDLVTSAYVFSRI